MPDTSMVHDKRARGAPRLLTDRPPSIEAEAQRPRIVPRSAADKVIRFGEIAPWWRDAYHNTLILSWPRFLVICAAVYVAANVVFALLYMIDPSGVAQARPGSFADAFFFSIQTMATIGYGVLYPTDLYTNIVVTAETLFALAILALVTGLFFARFSRPTAKVRFCRYAVVAKHNGVPTLQVRVANGRSNQILQASIEMLLLRSERTAEGVVFRRFHDLKLQRARTPIFALTFTLMHVIDETSPLRETTEAGLKEMEAELLIAITGLDETMSQTIHARHSYLVDEVRFGFRFADMFGYLPDGRAAIDLRRFDEIIPA